MKIFLILIVLLICTMYLIGTGGLFDLVPAEAKDSITDNLPVINRDALPQEDSSGKISFKIKGIDYSTKIGQMLVTIDDETYASTFDPISLLDPYDDGNGVIQFSMLIPKDSIKPGSSYTACIRILEDTDDFGNHFACHSGSTYETFSILGENETQQVNLYL